MNAYEWPLVVLATWYQPTQQTEKHGYRFAPEQTLAKEGVTHYEDDHENWLTSGMVALVSRYMAARGHRNHASFVQSERTGGPVAYLQQ